MLPLTEIQYMEQMAITVVLRSISLLLALYGIYTGYRVLRLKQKGFHVHYFRYRAIVVSLLVLMVFLILMTTELLKGLDIGGHKTAWLIYDIIQPLSIILFHNNTYYTVRREEQDPDAKDRYALFLEWIRDNKYGKSGKHNKY